VCALPAFHLRASRYDGQAASRATSKMKRASDSERATRTKRGAGAPASARLRPSGFGEVSPVALAKAEACKGVQGTKSPRLINAPCPPTLYELRRATGVSVSELTLKEWCALQDSNLRPPGS
jgi:hypothetical protein